MSETKAILTSPDPAAVRERFSDATIMSASDFQQQFGVEVVGSEIRSFGDKAEYSGELIVQLSFLVRDEVGNILVYSRADQGGERTTSGSSILCSGLPGEEAVNAQDIQRVVFQKVSLPEGIDLACNDKPTWIGFSPVKAGYLFLIHAMQVDGNRPQVSGIGQDSVVDWMTPEKAVEAVQDKPLEAALIEVIRV